MDELTLGGILLSDLDLGKVAPQALLSLLPNIVPVGQLVNQDGIEGHEKELSD